MTPAVVAPAFASFPVMCGESAEDSLSVREDNDTSDRNPDNSAAILYTQPAHVSASLCSVNMSQMVSVMAKEYCAPGVLLQSVLLPCTCDTEYVIFFPMT